MAVDAFVSKAKQVVLENLLNPQFGVSSLARKLGVSRSELYRRIKEAERKSASQFIREIRLERSLDLLMEDKHSIAEIAYMVGFNSPTYFSTCFKEYYGYPPSTTDQNGRASFTMPNDGRKSRKFRIPLILAALVIAITVAGIFAMQVREDLPEERSLAVLAFDYVGTDSAQSAKAIQLADEVLNALSNQGRLKVVAASSSFHVDKREPCQSIGRRLGVDYLVDGSLSDNEGSLKATVKLINAETGQQLWATSFGNDRNLLRSLPAGTSIMVANQIERFLFPSSQGPVLLADSRSRNLEATELYLRAKGLGDQRYKESISEAVELLEQAIVLDPYFAEAYGELSYLYGQMHFYGSLSRQNRDRLMTENLQKALDLNPESPEVRFAQTDYLYKTGRFTLDSTAIVSGFKELHQEDPDNARYCYRLFQVYRSMGQYDTSHNYLEKAVQLEHDSSFYLTILARDLFWKRGQKERAYQLLEEVTSQEKFHNSATCFKVAMLVDLPEKGYLPAVMEMQKALDAEPYSDWYLYWGFQLGLDLDMISLARKYNHLYEVKFPENPIYTYGTLMKLFVAERRFGDAMDHTAIWRKDNRLNPRTADANLARFYYLQGDFQRSLNILQSEFPEFLKKIETGDLEKGAIQPGEVEPIRTYAEVLQATGNREKAAIYSDFLCAYYSDHADAINFGNKLYPLDCLYLKGDLLGWLRAMEDVFFVRKERFRIYTELRTLRYREFESYPEYQELHKRIESEIHKIRKEAISYLRETGDWDPSWDTELP